MKKIFVFCLLFFIALSIFAQDESHDTAKRLAIGVGPEWNMNSRENFAMGAALSFDYNFAGSFSVGIAFTASSNFYGITVLEPAALFRWYFLGSDNAGWFVQGEAGCYLILEDGNVTPMFLGGLRGGVRLPFGETFYIEPYGRIGYPFAFGVGALAGLRF